MSNNASRHCHTTGSCYTGRKWWPIWLCGMLLAACEPRTIEIQGLDELTREIRSQRLQTSLRQPTAAKSQAISGEQIQAAMLPLRDVLTQIGASQRDLSERHAALTLEMRRWTQLLVQSMQSGRSEEAKQLDQRLADLENTIIEQDGRHRQVEALIGSALDKTADQLEAFLNHFSGASSPSNLPTETLPTGDTPAEQSGGNTVRAGGKIKASDTKADGIKADDKKRSSVRNSAPLNRARIDTSTRPAKNGVVPESNVKYPARNDGRYPNSADDNSLEQQASMNWLWALSVIALLSGFVLLFSRRRTQPMTPQPEMQFAPETAASIGQTDISRDNPTTADIGPATAETDEAEVEELWAAAALLGEAIDRLKQADDDDPPELGGAQALPDIPANDFETGSSIEPSMTIGDEDTHDAKMASEPDQHSDASPVDAATPPTEGANSTQPPTSENFALPGKNPDPANITKSPIPLTCQMHLPAEKHAASRVQRMLAADPRVLAHPEPTIRAEMGELEINFALLPGLPAGERSILEQQVRDTGA